MFSHIFQAGLPIVGLSNPLLLPSKALDLQTHTTVSGYNMIYKLTSVKCYMLHLGSILE